MYQKSIQISQSKMVAKNRLHIVRVYELLPLHWGGDEKLKTANNFVPRRFVLFGDRNELL